MSKGQISNQQKRMVQQYINIVIQKQIEYIKYLQSKNVSNYKISTNERYIKLRNELELMKVINCSCLKKVLAGQCTAPGLKKINKNAIQHVLNGGVIVIYESTKNIIEKLQIFTNKYAVNFILIKFIYSAVKILFVIQPKYFTLKSCNNKRDNINNIKINNDSNDVKNDGNSIDTKK